MKSSNVIRKLPSSYFNSILSASSFHFLSIYSFILSKFSLNSYVPSEKNPFHSTGFSDPQGFLILNNLYFPISIVSKIL